MLHRCKCGRMTTFGHMCVFCLESTYGFDTNEKAESDPAELDLYNSEEEDN